MVSKNSSDIKHEEVIFQEEYARSNYFGNSVKPQTPNPDTDLMNSITFSSKATSTPSNCNPLTAGSNSFSGECPSWVDFKAVQTPLNSD